MEEIVSGPVKVKNFPALENSWYRCCKKDIDNMFDFIITSECILFLGENTELSSDLNEINFMTE